MDDCIFCKIADGKIPSEKVYEDDELLAFRDVNPVAPTHILIIPKRHIANSDELTAGDEAMMGRIMMKAVELARDEGVAEKGYRLVINCGEEGGQVVKHLHLHLIGGRRFSDKLG